MKKAFLFASCIAFFANFGFAGTSVDITACENGNAEECAKVGDYFCLTAKDYTKAKKYYELARESGNIRGIFGLAILYANGYGVDKNPEKVKFYCEEARRINPSDGRFLVICGGQAK